MGIAIVGSQEAVLHRWDDGGQIRADCDGLFLASHMGLMTCVIFDSQSRLQIMDDFSPNDSESQASYQTNAVSA